MEDTPDSQRRLRRLRAAIIVVVAVAAACWTSLTRADAPAGHYLATAGVVSDTRTGLSWQQGAGPLVQGEDAAAYCAALDLDGAGWRVPTIKELLTLVDDTRSAPAIDPIFGCAPQEIEVSATVLARLAKYAQAYFVVGFADGHSAYGVPIQGANIRCVRDARTP